jgi:hypothetical protein
MIIKGKQRCHQLNVWERMGEVRRKFPDEDLINWEFGELGIWGFGDLGIWGFENLGIC